MGEYGPGLVPIQLCLGSLIHADLERTTHCGGGGKHMSQELPSSMTRSDGQAI